MTPDEQHSISDHLTAEVEAGSSIEACSEAVLDVELLRVSRVSQDPIDPENAILGLPFALMEPPPAAVKEPRCESAM